MTVNTTECNTVLLDTYLTNEVNEVELKWLISHLDSCCKCREHLEHHAATPEIWNVVPGLLKSTEFDQASTRECSAAAETAFDKPGMSARIERMLDSLAPSDDPHRLGRLGTYEVSGVVGAGAMGVVLKAVDPSLDRVVAIKVLTPHLANNPTARKRFAREAKAAAAVVHANVVPIHSVSSDGELPYLVMAYIRGGSLQDRLLREGALEPIEILRIGIQVAAGLAAAHEQGLVHRDIKPENILLEEGVERVTLTDFGLARAVDDSSLTQHGAIAGTPMYMSPEQARGEVVDQTSDLFSLGSVLYAICTGQPPFRDDTSYGVMRKIIDEEPCAINQLRPDAPAWLVAIINKLMVKQKSSRVQSAAEIQKLMEACLSHLQQPETATLPDELFVESTAKSKKRKPISAKFIKIGLLASLGLLGGFVVGLCVVLFTSWTSESEFGNVIPSGDQELGQKVLIEREKRTGTPPGAALLEAKIRGALDNYRTAMGKYPTTHEGLSALVAKPQAEESAKRWDGPYLDELPQDPWERGYLYGFPGKRSGSSENPDVWSAGPDGKKDTDDDLLIWTNYHQQTQDKSESQNEKQPEGNASDEIDLNQPATDFENGKVAKDWADLKIKLPKNYPTEMVPLVQSLNESRGQWRVQLQSTGEEKELKGKAVVVGGFNEAICRDRFPQWQYRIEFELDQKRQTISGAITLIPDSTKMSLMFTQQFNEGKTAKFIGKWDRTTRVIHWSAAQNFGDNSKHQLEMTFPLNGAIQFKKMRAADGTVVRDLNGKLTRQIAKASQQPFDLSLPNGYKIFIASRTDVHVSDPTGALVAGPNVVAFGYEGDIAFGVMQSGVKNNADKHGFFILNTSDGSLKKGLGKDEWLKELKELDLSPDPVLSDTGGNWPWGGSY